MVEHKPVLAKEVIDYLKPEPGKIYFDGTLGGAGHSNLILDSGVKHLYSFDQDINVINSIRDSSHKLRSDNWTLVHDNFANMANYCRKHDINIDGGVLLDLGFSSIQMDDMERGFSFNSEAQLDMRLDPEAELTAEIVINKYSEKEIADILFELGEERKSRIIAKKIIESRPIKTCKELAEIIKYVYVRGAQGKTFKTHPATKSFQALRIFVNDEIDVLKDTLRDIQKFMAPGARLAIISFHSLEDRIVKNYFRDGKKETWEILTKKPVIAGPEELHENPRARSAKLRVGKKL